MELQTPWSAQKTFDYLADLENFAKWDPGVRSSRQVTGTGPGPGATYEVTTASKRRSFTLTYTTVVYESPTKLVARAENGFVISEDHITVTASEPGSAVHYDANLRLKGLLAVFDVFLGKYFATIGGRAAKGLRAALDADAA